DLDREIREWIADRQGRDEDDRRDPARAPAPHPSGEDRGATVVDPGEAGPSDPAGRDARSRADAPEPETAPDLPTLDPPMAPVEAEPAEAAAITAPGPEDAAERPVASAVPDPSPRHVRLIAEVGRARGRAIGIAVPRFFIGRDRCCHLRCGHPAVSRIHAVIERRGDRAVLLDFGSTHGTFLNERRLEGDAEAELAEGDRLRVGPLLFRVAIESAPVAASARPGPAPVASPPEPPAVVPAPAPPPPSPVGSPEVPVTPTIHCPSCGDGAQLALDRIVGQILMTLGRALLQPGTPAGAVPAPPPAWPVAMTAAPATPASASPGHGATAPAPAMGGRHNPPARDASPGPAGRIEPASAPAPAAFRAVPEADSDPEYDLQSVLESAIGTGDPAPTGDETEIVPLAEEPEAPERPSPKAPTSEPPKRDGAAPAHGQRTNSEINLGVECPHCGAEVKAALGRLGQSLTCQACGATFHIDKSGEAILSGRRDERRPAAPAVSRPSPRGPSIRRTERWESIPRRPALIAAAAGLVLFVLARWFLSGPDLPAALPDRVVAAAEAFARADRRRLAAFAAPGTSGELASWLDRTRPKAWDTSAGEFKITPKLARSSKKEKTCSFLVTIRPSGAQVPAVPPGSKSTRTGPAPAADTGSLTLTLHWVERGPSGWLLDGHQTLEDRAAAPAPVLEPVAAVTPAGRKGGRRVQVEVP
ncbi:MAG TPA: FHA domain-containing protein, partial [Isosphaeraceae bacterium]